MAKETPEILTEEVTKATKGRVKENLVSVRVPRGEDKYVSVNGENYILPAGKVSEVPKFIADEIARSDSAVEAYEELKEKMLAETEKHPQ